MTSFSIVDKHKSSHFVTLNSSAKLWDLCILDHGTVSTSKDVQQLAMEYPYPEHSCRPGPLFRCLIMHVEETKSAAMVMYGQ
jgi:hypothetical protein